MADTVFINKLSAIHKGSPGKSMAFPDVNLCPPAPPAGPIPTPLPNIAQAADLAGGASTVKINGNPIAKKSSYFAKSTGNAMARSTGGGILSHVVEGKAYFTSFSMNVKVEGEPVPRHLDMMTHNHAAPAPGEAVGTYLGSMQMAMPKIPVVPEPKARKDDGKPFDYEITVDATSLGESGVTYKLESHDGAYSAVLSNAGAIGEGKTKLSAKAVPPGKVYSLWAIKGQFRSALFQAVPSSLLSMHGEAVGKLEVVEPEVGEAVQLKVESD